MFWKEVVDVVELDEKLTRAARAVKATEGGARIENEKKTRMNGV